MGNHFFETAFTPRVKAEQTRHGSRSAYARLEGPEGRGPANDRLGEQEVAFIARRDSFYLATVSETGWPYVQHRGGPPGFVRSLDHGTLAWPDFSGNRQYVSIGNAASSDRVALFFMDYPNQLRLKVLGHVRTFEPAERPELAEALTLNGYRAATEHYLRVDVEAFDWNCPQHITPRYTPAEIETATAPLRARIAELEAKLTVALSRGE